MQPYWSRFAAAVATFAETKLETTSRGALLIRCVGDGSTVLGLYGNDNYLRDERARTEVSLLRQQLAQAPVKELGFGVSFDGRSWALVLQSSLPHFQTVAGQAFQAEMLKLTLEELVERAWQKAAPPGATPSLDSESVIL